MFKAFTKVTAPTDKSKEIKKALDSLSKKDVLVGIPQEESSREGEITNAELAYIHTHGVRQKEMRAEMQPDIDKGKPYSKVYELYLHTHGSPLWHSPPRPIIEPAIEDKENQAPITKELKQVVSSALDGKEGEAEKHLQLAGMAGQNAARGWFDNSKNGWAPNSPRTVKLKKSDQPLIDTGDLRKAITYVVRKRK